MFVLSSYRLSDENNARIAEAIHSHGGTFVPTSFDDELDTVIQRIETHIGEATIFIGGRLTEEQWKKGKMLLWINVPWAGVNALLGIQGIRESGVLITNSSGVMADSVADQVMAYLIMLNRSLPKQLRAQTRHEWNRYTTVEHPDRRILRGMTLGIIGYGAIGKAVAERAVAFGMNVIAVKRDAKSTPEGIDVCYTKEDLPTLLLESDFVVVALPLTPETEASIGMDQFRQMRRTAHFVNIARGKIVRQDELIEALQTGVIAGAALDVLEREPLPEDSPLWDMENVILTPHSSGGHVGFGDGVTDLFIDNLGRFVAGQTMHNRIDLGEGY